MALTDSEKLRIKYFLGYQGVSEQAVLLTGIPHFVQSVRTIDANLEKLLDGALDLVRTLLNRLEVTEEQLFCAQSRLKVRVAGDVEFNREERQALKDAYLTWAKRLADLIGVYLYAAGYLQFMDSGSQVSVPRVHG